MGDKIVIPQIRTNVEFNVKWFTNRYSPQTTHLTQTSCLHTFLNISQDNLCIAVERFN